MPINFQWRNRPETKKIATIVGSFILVAVFGWYIASKINAQVPPPGTAICAIMPSLCQGSSQPPPPPVAQYTITKEVSAINGDGAKTSGSVKQGDTIKYKIGVKTGTTGGGGITPSIIGWAGPGLTQLNNDGTYNLDNFRNLSFPRFHGNDIVDMKVIDEKTIYASGTPHRIVKTADGGATWQELLEKNKLKQVNGNDNIYDYDESRVIKFDVAKNNPNNLAAIVYIPTPLNKPGTYRLVLISSADGGIHWKNIAVPGTLSYGEVGYSNDNEIWVSANACKSKRNHPWGGIDCSYDVYSLDNVNPNQNAIDDWKKRTNNSRVSLEPGHANVYPYYGQGEFISISSTEAYMTYSEQIINYGDFPGGSNGTPSLHVIKIINGVVEDITGDLNSIAATSWLVPPGCKPIKIEKDHKNIIYVITQSCGGSMGLKLIKSNDGGKHWTAAQNKIDVSGQFFMSHDPKYGNQTVDLTKTKRWVHFIDIDLDADDNLYAAVDVPGVSHDALILKSIDKGDSWIIAYSPTDRYKAFNLIEMLVLP